MSSSNVRVRRATRADVAALVEFNAAMAFETEGKELDRTVLTAGVEAVFDEPARGGYWIAEQGGGIAGGLLITTEWSDWRNGTFWWIQSVFVREEHRGKGVYGALYRELERQAREDPDVCGIRLYVEDENARAQAVYEKLGMRRAHYRLYEVDFVL